MKTLKMLKCNLELENNSESLQKQTGFILNKKIQRYRDKNTLYRNNVRIIGYNTRFSQLCVPSVH